MSKPIKITAEKTGGIHIMIPVSKNSLIRFCPLCELILLYWPDPQDLIKLVNGDESAIHLVAPYGIYIEINVDPGGTL